MNKKSRELSGITAEILLEVIDSLNKIDETNKALDDSNKELAKSNYRLQVIAVAIATVGVIAAIFFGMIALQQKSPILLTCNCDNAKMES